MDETRFDNLTRLVSCAAGGRRSILGAVLGFAAAPLLAIGTIAGKRQKQRRRATERNRPQAHSEGKKKKCKQGKKCAGRVCGNFGCKGSSCGSCSGGNVCNSQGQCVACTPNCTGKQCGSNGCGGSCGSCPGGQSCSANGTCQAICTPNCNGKTCGSNGCSGSCGTCTGNTVCSNLGSGGVCQCAGGGTSIGIDCWPDSEETTFLTLLNTYRSNNGKPQLTSQSQLVAAAELHSQYQASVGVGGHGGPGGNTAEDRIEQQGYDWSAWGENVYWGSGGNTGTAQSALTWWQNSPGHNANMLSTDYTQVGIGRAFRSPNTWYWTTVFATPG